MPRPVNPARAQAMLMGDRHYKGAPCPNGHDGRRYTSTRACVDCVSETGRGKRGN